MNTLQCNTILVACALVFFTKGFLLIKLEIGHKSNSCSGMPDGDVNCHNLMGSDSLYKKLVIIIIDALRHDFAFFQGDNVTKMPFHNNMPVFHDMIEQKGCKNAQLWRFKADAPTATMPRLKGLTTGSLPTFIDVSGNFASSEITEDNLLDQFLQSKLNITFMGDDTWMGLFPGRFNKAFPYPSFDVKDLHLVDDGVIEHLLPELGKTDWQVLIAHFLGVDHCGHRYGPFHPEMPKKLKQMDGIVRDVIDVIDNDTLMLVMGDHGMTPTGDHGGETFNEVSAALFAYNAAGLFSECSDGEDPEREVNQVDIVPTISLLLGTSIPFANLGIVMKDMLPKSEGHVAKAILLEALAKNLQQMHAYIKTYQKVTRSLPTEQYQNLEDAIENLQNAQATNLSHKFLEEQYRKIMHSARDMCQMVWAKFNIGLMLCGLSVLFYWLFITCNVQKSRFVYFNLNSMSIITFLLLFVCIFIPNLTIIGGEYISNTLSWAMVIFISIAVVVQSCRPTFVFDSRTLCALAFAIFYAISFTSNSFVLNEDIVVLYLLASALAILCFDCSKFNVRKASERLHNVPDENVTLLAYVKDCVMLPKSYTNTPGFWYILVILSCVRFSFFFRVCRAEQFWCFDENSATTATDHTYVTFWTVLSCLSLVAYVLYAVARTKSYRGMESYHNKLIILSSILCATHWILLTFLDKVHETLPSWIATLFPRCTFAILLVHFLFQWIDPTISCINIEKFKSKHSTSHWTEMVFGKVDLENWTKKNEDRLPSKDCDLAYVDEKYKTQYLHPHQAVMYLTVSRLILCFTVLFSLLLGPMHATAIPLWMVAAHCYFRSIQFKKPNYFTVITWNLLCSYWWFATGHQASLSSIRWDAAFVGFQGNHVTNVIPAALLVLDTFSVQILSSVCLPILLVTARIPGKNASDVIEKDLLDIYTKHYLYHVIKMIGCMVAALIHRRHLMIWWIFAPRFIFELLSILFVMLSSLFTFTFVQRCNRKVQLYINNMK